LEIVNFNFIFIFIFDFTSISTSTSTLIPPLRQEVRARILTLSLSLQCDEQHPACRNCQKSKRECLGYDPIFKQAPGPAPIQPAPSAAPSMTSTSAIANPYGNQPQMLGGGYAAAPSMTYEPALSAGVSSPGSAGQQFDYASAIDPALEAAAPPTGAPGNRYGGQPGMQAHRPGVFSRDIQSPSPYPPSPSDTHTPHLRGGAFSIIPPSVDFAGEVAYTIASAKRTVDELLDLGGVAPTPPPFNLMQSDTMLDEAKHLFYSIYAPGLESFLESKWYSSKGLPHVLNDRNILNKLGNLLDQFAISNAGNDPAEMAYTSSVEARTVWAFALMVRDAAAEMHSVNPGLVPATDDPVEAAHRLTVFESLLTGRVAGTNPLTQPVPGSTDHHRLRELEFWFTMGNFVCLSYDDPGSTKDVDDTLAALRNLLDGRENRDVLYSVAVVRALSQRVSEYTESDQPLHLDESDNKSKLLVAKKFIMDEGAGAGTTNVIRRLCELAARSWTAPVTTAAPAATTTADTAANNTTTTAAYITTTDTSAPDSTSTATATDTAAATATETATEAK